MRNSIRLKTFLPAVLFVATVGLLATDIYLPSFPAIGKALFTSNKFVQLSFSLFLLSFSLSQLFYGPYSEKHGRKKIILFGLAFSLIGTFICMIANNISIFILGRFLQGLGLGVGPALFRAILRDTFKGNLFARINSILAVGTACIMALAPTLGGYIQSFFGWRFNFVFILLYTALGIVLVWRWLPETLPISSIHATKIKTIISTFYKLLKSPIFMGYAICASLTFAGLTAYLVMSPFVFQDVIGLTPVQYGWLALIIAGALALGGFTNASLVKKIGRHLMLKLGVLIMILGGALMMLLAVRYLNTLAIILPMFIYITGAGIAFGNLTAGALHHFPRIAGFAAALFGTIQILGSAIGTSIMSAIHERNQIPLSIFLLVAGIACFFLQHLSHHFSKKLEEEEA